MLRAAVAEFNLGAHRGQQSAFGFDIANLRNVFENDRLIGEQGGSHRRQARRSSHR